MSNRPYDPMLAIGKSLNFSVVGPVQWRVQSNITKLTGSQRLQKSDDVCRAEPLSKGNKFMINRRLVLGRSRQLPRSTRLWHRVREGEDHSMEKTCLAKTSKRMASTRSIRLGKKSMCCRSEPARLPAVTAAGMPSEESEVCVRSWLRRPLDHACQHAARTADVYYYGYWSMTILPIPTFGSRPTT